MDKFLKRILLFLTYSLLLFCSVIAAQRNVYHNRPTVNLLQWWGYVISSDPYVKKIEDDCDVNISYDQFYSNGEFMQRMTEPGVSYDIIIFSDTIFKGIESKIANNKSQLYKVAQKYYPRVREVYYANHFPHNVLFFVHSLTGFLYNPINMQPIVSNNMFELFEKAKGKLVVMIDDPVEAEFMLSLGLRQIKKQGAELNQNIDLVPLTIDNFRKLYSGTKVIITNLPGKISSKTNFAFAFQWSGDAIKLMRNSKGRLKFFVHPKLSYVSSDLLATLNNKRATVCVAKKLASKWYLDHEQNLTTYFSPYVDGSSIKDVYFKGVFNDWVKHLNHLPWLISVDEEHFDRLTRAWDTIKLKISEQKNS